MGNHRHPTADSQNERRRSANLARADARAHRQRLAHLPDRKTHAVELQGLNGLSFALTHRQRYFILTLAPRPHTRNWPSLPTKPATSFAEASEMKPSSMSASSMPAFANSG